MIFIHDKRIPKEAIVNLNKYGQCLPFLSINATNNELAGHPDLFFCNINNKLIVEPSIINKLPLNKNNLIKGKSLTGKNTQATHYNAVVTNSYIIHNRKYTDKAILDLQDNRQFINIRQAFTRCSLLPLPNNSYITSDAGIAKELNKYKFDFIYVNPNEIILPGYNNGCIGGCLGIIDHTVFLIGSLKFHSDGNAMIQFLKKRHCELIELYHGKLFDGGSIIIYDPEK